MGGHNQDRGVKIILKTEKKNKNEILLKVCLYSTTVPHLLKVHDDGTSQVFLRGHNREGPSIWSP